MENNQYKITYDTDFGQCSIVVTDGAESIENGKGVGIELVRPKSTVSTELPNFISYASDETERTMLIVSYQGAKALRDALNALLG